MILTRPSTLEDISQGDVLLRDDNLVVVLSCNELFCELLEILREETPRVIKWMKLYPLLGKGQYYRADLHTTGYVNKWEFLFTVDDHVSCTPNLVYR